MITIRSSTDCCWQCGDVEIIGGDFKCCGRVTGWASGGAGRKLEFQASCQGCGYLWHYDLGEIVDERTPGKRYGVDCGHCESGPPRLATSAGRWYRCDECEALTLVESGKPRRPLPTETKEVLDVFVDGIFRNEQFFRMFKS